MTDLHLCNEDDVLGWPGMPPCPHPDPEFDPELGATFCMTCLRKMPDARLQ